MNEPKEPTTKLLAHCWRCQGPVYVGAKTTGEEDTTAPDNRVRHFSCEPWGRKRWRK